MPIVLRDNLKFSESDMGLYMSTFMVSSGVFSVLCVKPIADRFNGMTILVWSVKLPLPPTILLRLSAPLSPFLFICSPPTRSHFVPRLTSRHSTRTCNTSLCWKHARGRAQAQLSHTGPTIVPNTHCPCEHVRAPMKVCGLHDICVFPQGARRHADCFWWRRDGIRYTHLHSLHPRRSLHSLSFC